MPTYTFRVTKSPSRLGFAAQADDPRFERVLTVDGKPAYEVGPKCWSCQFSICRLPHADAYQSDGGEQPSIGLRLTQELVKAVWKQLPDGTYLAMDLLEEPRLVTPAGPGDYFDEELPRSFDLPVNEQTGTDYYRSRSLEFGDAGTRRALFEFILPLAAQEGLHSDVVEAYEENWMRQRSPAIAIALLEVHGPSDWRDGFLPEFKEHWCLTHFLLDGHHRMLAAARRKRRLRLVSFLAMDSSAASREDLEKVPSLLKLAPPTELTGFQPE